MELARFIARQTPRRIAEIHSEAAAARMFCEAASEIDLSILETVLPDILKGRYECVNGGTTHLEALSNEIRRAAWEM